MGTRIYNKCVINNKTISFSKFTQDQLLEWFQGRAAEGAGGWHAFFLEAQPKLGDQRFLSFEY